MTKKSQKKPEAVDKVVAEEVKAAGSPKEEPKAAPVKVEAKTAPYSIAKGKAVTTKRGILSDGSEVKASDLSGGDDALQAFVKTGHVVKA